MPPIDRESKNSSIWVPGPGDNFDLPTSHVLPDLVRKFHGEDVTIRELAELVVSVIGYTRTLKFDPTKSDGTPRKLLDVSRLNGVG
jgi:hypothetical protein